MRQLALIGLFTLAVALLPLFVTSGFLLNVVIMTLYATLLGQAWNILGGFGGQFSFGHAVFFGTGAYAMAVLQTKFGVNAWLALPAALALGALVGVLVGSLSFRYGLKGSYFALVTLAFAEVFRILANNFQFTGAGVGIQIRLADSAAEMQFATKAGFLYAALALATIGLLVAWWLKRSRYGAWLQAVRDNEDSAAALGVDVFRVKLGAIAISGALMAAGGAFYLQYFRYVDPHIAYGPAISVEALLAAIVGGMGTVFGPLAGAVALHLLGEVTRGLFEQAPGANLMIYGVLLVLIVMFLPRGIMGLFGRRG
jgi:branched-chain amino acid transport system permease protein